MNRVRGLLSALPSVPLPSAVEEEAKDLLCRAQAALLDEHPGAARRSLRRLHELLVPALDQAFARTDKGCVENEESGGALSAGIGFPGLHGELPDLDVEREHPLELLVGYAARAGDVAFQAGCMSAMADDLAFAPVLSGDTEGLAAQWAAIEALLEAAPLPRSRFWRRLFRGIAGPLGDRARVQVVRGAAVVLDRPPLEAAGPVSGDPRTDLGEFWDGDRMMLQLPMPLPGRVAVFHGAGNESEAELTLILPTLLGEDTPRRAHEVVEVVGELFAVAGKSEHGMVVVWTPELLPAGWVLRTLRERRLPPDSRAWLYRYRVRGPAPTPACG